MMAGGGGGGGNGGGSGRGQGWGPRRKGRCRSGGAGGSGAATGGRGHAGTDDGGVGHGHAGRGVGNAVSEAATSTAHAGKAAAQEAGFSNLGQAVSSAVHDAQGKTGSQTGANSGTRGDVHQVRGSQVDERADGYLDADAGTHEHGPSGFDSRAHRQSPGEGQRAPRSARR